MINNKILILGANYETIPLIQNALSKKLHVYVADHIKNSKGKLVPGVIPVDIDGSDIDALENYCRKNGIGSVMVGVADRLVNSYAVLCDRLNTFCMIDTATSEILSNKLLFNQFLFKNNLDHIETFSVNEAYHFLRSGKKAIVKPVDGNSGKGLSICDKENELDAALEFAQINSASQKVLIEPYLDDPGIGLYFTFSDYKCINVCIYDRYTAPDFLNINKVPIAGLYPSKYQGLFHEKYSQDLLNALYKLNIKCGVLMISGFINNKKLRLYDPGFRLQGEGADVIVKYNYEIDQLSELVNFAQDGKFCLQKNSVDNKESFASIWLLLKEGEVCGIHGMDIISAMSEVIEVRQRFSVGDTVTKEELGTEGQVFARIYIKAKERKLLREISNQIFKNIQVVDTDGNDLLIRTLDNTFWAKNG